MREPSLSDGSDDVCSTVEIFVEFSPLCSGLSEEFNEEVDEKVDEVDVLLSAESFYLLSELLFEQPAQSSNAARIIAENLLRASLKTGLNRENRQGTSAAGKADEARLYASVLRSCGATGA